MRRELMAVLACPVCKADLQLEVTTEEEGEIISGKLTCVSCARSYPIEDAIPNFLVPEAEDKP